MRLALALIVAALLPMSVMVGLPLLRAGQRAKDDAEARLQQARRQAAFLVKRAQENVALRLVRAGWDLSKDRAALEVVLAGPAEPADAVAHAAAERNGLDELHILGEDGTLLASSRRDGPTDPGTLVAALGEAAETVRLVPTAEGSGPGAIAVFARQDVLADRERLVVVGARAIGDELVRDAAEITGEEAALVDGSGRVIATAGTPPHPLDTARVRGHVPLEGGEYRVLLSVPAGDVRRQRRDLLAAFAGVAPLALLSALAVGVLLAAGISRPIRALAERADAISNEGGARLLLDREPDEVRRLSLSFDRMLLSLGQSEERRVAAERVAAWQDVARRVAHEVKNPLSPIKLAVENLRRTRAKAPLKLADALDVEGAVILEEVDGLRRLVDEFSQFARLPRPTIAPCDPREVVAQAVALLRPRIEAQEVALTVDTTAAPERLDADPEQLGRVLKNVLGNALDALAGAPRRELAVRVAREESPAGGTCVLEVRDTGAGLDEEARRRIFEPYFTTRRESGGTGLGMSIVFRIVAEHGGAVSADGAPGRGATITVRLPLAGPHAG